MLSQTIFSSLDIKGDRSGGQGEGTGGLLWGGTRGGLCLLDYLRTLGIYSDRQPRVLGLGSGLGALELTCASCLGAHVIATDLPCVMPLLCRNVEVNALALGDGAVKATCLDWNDGELPPEVAAEPFDFILASDCVYWPSLFQPLIRTLCSLSSLGTIAPPVFFVIEARSTNELQFLSALEAAGFAFGNLDELHGETLEPLISGASAVIWARRILN